MKRRNFLHHSALGVTGLSLSGQVISGSIFEKAEVRHWFAQLVRITGAKKQSGFFIDKKLSNVVETIRDDYKNKSFKAAGAGVYFYGEDQYCFFPLELARPSSGLCEFLVPVLHFKDNAWRLLTTLNGYQLEALVHAGQHMSDSSITMQQLLLPVQKKSGDFYPGFCTASGGIEMTTTITLDNTARTEIAVHTGNQIARRFSYTSSHCLSCSGLLI